MHSRWLSEIMFSFSIYFSSIGIAIVAIFSCITNAVKTSPLHKPVNEMLCGCNFKPGLIKGGMPKHYL